MMETIYVKLLDEGIDVWRPVLAEKIGTAYRLVSAPKGEDISGENWEFPIASLVTCEERDLDGKRHKIAIKKLRS